MADHRAENIIAAVVTAVTGLTTTGARVYRGRRYELDVDASPSLCVYLGPDLPLSGPGDSPLAYQDSELTVYIEGVVKNSTTAVATTLNQIRHEVAVALNADHTQGLAYVHNTTEGETLLDIGVETDKPVGRMRTAWLFLYRRQRYVA